MRRFASLLLPLALSAGLLAALPAAAGGLPTLVPAECQGTATLSECGLNSAVQVFINVALFIFGISGSVALAMFVYGGFLWLTSAGSPEKVKQGQAVISGAVVGLIIIFGAYVGVQFLLTALRGTVAPGEVAIQGERCGSGDEAGLAVYTGNPAATSTGGLECIPFGQCGRIGDGWDQQTITDANRDSYDCVDGLLPGEAENVKCCHLNPGASPTGTGDASGSGSGSSPRPEGTSGRNNCTCADRGVNSVADCAACGAFCSSRSSTVSEYTGPGGMSSCAESCTVSRDCSDPLAVCDGGRCVSVASRGRCTISCSGAACRTGAEARTGCTAGGGTYDAGANTCTFGMDEPTCRSIDAGTAAGYEDRPDRSISASWSP